MHITRKLCLVPIFVALMSCGGADLPQTQVMIASDGYAIHGFDAVGYFTEGVALKGSEEFSAEWNGANWLFHSAENRDLFQANPERYAPQYGGWCAYGVAEGYAAETDPENAWAIHNDKLYLNWDEEVASEWEANKGALLQSSENKWPGVRQQLGANDATVYWHD
ncbi:MAG: YHS domain-containing (seleno)protein [Pseudomonadota bacterium]